MKKSSLLLLGILFLILGSSLFVLIKYLGSIQHHTNKNTRNLSQENNFGINATVYHNNKPFSCTSGAPCPNPLVYYLEISSKSKTFLLDYKICDGTSCISEKDEFVENLDSGGTIIRLPNLNWNDNDLVDIKVQLPVNGSLEFDKNSAYDPVNTHKFWVDLGMSKIISEY